MKKAVAARLSSFPRLVVAIAIFALVAADGAQAHNISFTGNSITPANSRSVSPWRTYNYGAGVWGGELFDGQSACVGAKDNADGSGGNAIPFLCTTIRLNQSIWTPGGDYGWGYGTLINRMSTPLYAGGMLNIR